MGLGSLIDTTAGLPSPAVFLALPVAKPSPNPILLSTPSHVA